MTDVREGPEHVSRDDLAALTRRTDAPGLRQLTGHGGALAATGLAVAVSRDSPWLAPALVAHGIVLVFLFAALHECIHETAFQRHWLNKIVGWVGGVLLVLPPGYFRAFHFAHHAHTQDPERDPELAKPKPNSLGAYLVTVSGLPYWRERVTTSLRHALGGAVREQFIPAEAQDAVVTEARWLWGFYVLVAASALVTGMWPAVLIFWIAPALLGQPALRLFLLAEHTGRPLIPDMLANSRTLRSNSLIRRLAWNMPYHAEHHRYPSVPFHALPMLHEKIGGHIAEVAPGYAALHRELVRSFRRA